MYNKIVSAEGSENSILLGGTAGGALLMQPTGAAPGALPLVTLQTRVWHLLREPNPYTNPSQTSGDYPAQAVTDALNVQLADFISMTGIAPDISDVFKTFPVFAGLDYPVPPDLVSLRRIEYTPNGQYPYKLVGMSDQEWDQVTGLIVPPSVGQPYYYRQPIAGYIRLQPQPGLGNATGAPAGVYTLLGIPYAGQVITLFLISNINSVTLTYTVLVTDTLNSIALALVNLINASVAVQGSSSYAAFLSPAVITQQAQSQTVPPFSNAVQATVTCYAATQFAAAANYSLYATITGPNASQLSLTPTIATNFQPTGDIMTWYYSSLGMVLNLPGDTPHIPPQFHMALVYGVLADFWQRKASPIQSEYYLKRYAEMVKRGKAYTFDLNRSNQPTMGGADDYLFPETAIG